jgi:hypothetical protein
MRAMAPPRRPSALLWPAYRLRLALAAACALGCNTAPDRRDAVPSASASATPKTTASVAPAAAPTVSGSPAPSGVTTDEIAGSWEGRYDAKKGKVALPPKVKDKALAADDGKAAVGPGLIELTISPGGDVRGKTSGALGAGGISGRVDGAMVRTVVQPDDPRATDAMTGIFIGERRGEIIAGELHVAGPDGTMIRESSVELRRKKL